MNRTMFTGMLVAEFQTAEVLQLYAYCTDNTNTETNKMSICPIRTQNYSTCLPRVHGLSDRHHVGRNHYAPGETSHACYACPVLRHCRPLSTQQTGTHVL